MGNGSNWMSKRVFFAANFGPTLSPGDWCWVRASVITIRILRLPAFPSFVSTCFGIAESHSNAESPADFATRPLSLRQ
jgi:hypothetical protein